MTGGQESALTHGILCSWDRLIKAKETTSLYQFALSIMGRPNRYSKSILDHNMLSFGMLHVCVCSCPRVYVCVQGDASPEKQKCSVSIINRANCNFWGREDVLWRNYWMENCHFCCYGIVSFICICVPCLLVCGGRCLLEKCMQQMSFYREGENGTLLETVELWPKVLSL